MLPQFLIILLLTAFWSPARSQLATAFKITGAVGGNGSLTSSLPSRFEINGFATSGPAFDLFVLALQRFQSTNQSDPLSYFQVAGIHGFPSVPWDGVIGTGRLPGYCMHFSTTFPVWHRPYLALYEQILWTHAQDIAKTYPSDQRERYRTAAVSLRIPYWDWVIHPQLPVVVTTPTIFVNAPTGWHEIKNPLYRYDFHPGLEGNGFPANHTLARAQYTLRHPSVDMSQSDQTAATAAMLANAASVHATTYQLLTSSISFSHFSTAASSSNKEDHDTNNIESIHNTIHDQIGGTNGSMHFTDFAAFDPIFFLHHAQVDRLVAIWQALNPFDYIVPTVNGHGSYYELPNTIESITTPLAPFHSDSGTTMFTPETVRYPAQFGYTYPELDGLTGNSSTQQATLRGRINSLYNPNPVTLRTGKLRRNIDIVNAFQHVDLDLAQQLGVNNLDMQWSISVRLGHSAYSSISAIDFYLGQLPWDETIRFTKSSLVGTLGLFNSVTSSSDYDTPAINARGEISITHALAAGVSRGALSGLSPGDIVPVLRDILYWKAKSQGGHEVCLDGIDGITISVLSRRVTPSNSTSEFPMYGEYQIHPEATTGKAGGFSGTL